MYKINSYIVVVWLCRDEPPFFHGPFPNRHSAGAWIKEQGFSLVPSEIRAVYGTEPVAQTKE